VIRYKCLICSRVLSGKGSCGKIDRHVRKEHGISREAIRSSYVRETDEVLDKGPDAIECRICGRKFQLLNYHIIGTHKMPVARYVEKYGGPTVSDAWAKSRAASRFDRPGAREAQAKVIADLNRV
jgi:hypothetical protein